MNCVREAVLDKLRFMQSFFRFPFSKDNPETAS